MLRTLCPLVARRFSVLVNVILLFLAGLQIALHDPILARSSSLATRLSIVPSHTTTHYELPSGVIHSSSPAVGDLNGDGLPEIVIGTTSQNAESGLHDRPARLLAMQGDGAFLLNVEVGAPINSTPALGDLTGDGRLDIVVGIGADTSHPTQHYHGGVVAYELLPGNLNGRLLWRFQTQDTYEPYGFADGVFSSPALCDLDNDGVSEVIFGAWDQHIYVLDNQGQSRWNNIQPNAPPNLPGYLNGDTVWSSPACADLVGDEAKEIVIGADISHGGILPDGTEPDDGGFLYIFDKDGQVLARRYFPEAFYASPAIGDLDRDGTLEIVIGTAYSWWQETGGAIPPYVYAFSTRELGSNRPYQDPAKLPDLPGWPRPTAYPGYSSPSLADLDGDGDLEIVIGSGKPDGASEPWQCSHAATDPDCYGAVYAWHHDGTAVAGFPVWPQDYLNKNAFVRSSPAILDWDNDNQLEIVVSMLWDLIVIGPDGQQEENLHTTWTVDASPAVTDSDGNGNVELWIGGGRDEARHAGHLWRFEHPVAGARRVPWPMFRLDGWHTAHYGRLESSLTAPPLVVLHPLSGGAMAQSLLTLRVTGSATIQWELVEAPVRVSLDPSSGSAPPGETTVKVWLDSQGLAPGPHALGSIRIQATESGSGTTLPEVEIPVTLILDSHRTYLPMVQ